jgi:hypothetical protein
MYVTKGASCDSLPPMGDEVSKLRQQLRRGAELYQRQLELVLGERGPLIRGSFGTRARVCGNPNCRCARGELHESKFLSASQGSGTRQVHVPAADEVRVSAGVDRYRRFYRARAELAQNVKRQLELIDALGCSLLEPYPADNPLPAAKRRGRPPKRPTGAP